MSTSAPCETTNVIQARASGVEVRIQLAPSPKLITSTLPSRQARCLGWHTMLPAGRPGILPPVREATLGAFAAAAAAAHDADPAQVVLFSPRPLAVGVFCACGARDERVFGQVGRLRCPSCGALAPAPLSVAHVVSPALARPDLTFRSAGFPAGDMIWSTVSVSPRGAWLPWVFGPPEAGPPGRPRIGLVGLGAIGYPTSEILVRRGYPVDLADFDEVEEKNVSGSYRVSAVGQPKAFASRDRLRELVPDADVRAWHGDIICDIGLGLMRQWSAAILCLDRASAKVAASRYLELLGVPYLQAQIDGASRSALVRAYEPGKTCCLQCLLEADETEFDAVYGCRPEPRSAGGAGPALFTTPVESFIAAGLVASQLSELVPPPGRGPAPAAPNGEAQ